MSRVILAFLLFFLPSLALADDVPQRTVDLGWITVTAPEKMPVGKKFTLTLTIKQSAPDMQVGGDVHLTKANGDYLTYGNWGGPPSSFQLNKPFTRTYTMPVPKDESAGMFVHLYLTPKGKGWNERVKDAPGPVIFNDGVWVDPDARPATATMKKSWMKLGQLRKADGGSPGDGWVEGDEVILPIQYYVDPADDWGKTAINIWAAGPWVDNPDGKYTTRRVHNNPPGLRGGSIPCEIGKVTTVEFKTKLPKPYSAGAPEAGVMGDSVLFICAFRGKDNQNWPWELRTGMGEFTRKNAFFELDAPTPGNLFTYDQPVKMHIRLGNLAVAEPGEKVLKYAVQNTKNEQVMAGEISFNAKTEGQIVEIPLPLTERGTFMITATVDGWETRATTFARIPDLQKIIGDGLTPFGGQKFAGNEEAVQAARMLGMSRCRVWTNWNMLQPAANVWNEDAFAALHKQLDELNRHHVRPWLLLDQPPAWAIDNPESWRLRFSPAKLRDAEVRKIVTRLATEFKGKISGFEWLNEIVPGQDTPTPVEDYVHFCAVATAAAMKIDPDFEIQLAGGLWPRSFLKSVLAAGVAEHIDILPVHYSDKTGVLQARADLAAVGAEKRVKIWDNETAAGLSTWTMPLSEAITDRTQSDWFMRQFPGELLAGCEQITVFGGEPDPAGNWSHFWGDMSPRPSAATLAVLAEKLATAKPLGEFRLGKGGRFQVFETLPGKPTVMVVSTTEPAGETVSLPVGNLAKVIATDQQGNSQELPVIVGKVRLPLTTSPYFVECNNVNALKAQLAVQVAGDDGVPHLYFIKDAKASVPVRVKNFSGMPTTATVNLPDGSNAKPLVLKLNPWESVQTVLEFQPPAADTFTAGVIVSFDQSSPPVIKPFKGTVIRPDQLGNLLKNPGFEQAGTKDTEAKDWSGTGTHADRVLHTAADEPGHGDSVIRFKDTGGAYKSFSQNLDALPPGDYVYSLWIKADDLQTGSNVMLNHPDGNQLLTWMRIFHSPKSQPYWDVLRARVTVPEGTTSVGIAPVANGAGESFIDNAVLARYEGTEYTAFVPRAKAKKIDGDLSDFDRSQPIPLLGKSQLRAGADYQWSPQNLAGVAWLNWDEQNLYLAVEVVDDKHVAGKRDAGCIQDDSVELAIHPLNRQPGEDGKAFVFYLSGAHPGGSGSHTLYRPAEKSGGLKAGILARDSGLYEIAVKREGNKTTYEVAMPLTDLGGITPTVGGKIGLSLALHDNDGSDAPARRATMLWGEGLYPAWSPAGFGIATLLDDAE